MHGMYRLHRLLAAGCVSLMLLLASAANGQDLGSLNVQQLEARVADLLDRTCAQAGCHAGPNPQMGMPLTRDQFYAATVGEPSLERPDLMRVHPGRPDSSYLVMKVQGDPGIIGAPMPFTGDRLSEEEIATIEAWVRKLEGVDTARKQQATDQPAYPFNGWRVLNLPTTRSIDAGQHLFLISHRFNPTLGSGYDALYGLDGSGIIFLSWGYAITDRFLAMLGRSNAADDVELQLRYEIKQQRVPTGFPLGISVQLAGNWLSEKVPGEDRLRSDVLKLTGQLSLTRRFADHASLAVVPGLLLNPNELEDGEAPLVTVGLGGRVDLWDRGALILEWVPIVSGYTRSNLFGNDIRFDSWGGGLELTIGGHVFQIVLTNSVGLATDQYLRGGDLDVRDFFDGDIRLGFNIFRILNF